MEGCYWAEEGEGMRLGFGGWRCIYLTVRACSSIGAPERTAAGVVSPGSLPSMTLEGTGEKFLRFVSAAQADTVGFWPW